MVSWVWKMDFNQTPVKWTRMNNINNQRHRHECAFIKVRKSIGKLFDFGVWIQAVVIKFRYSEKATQKWKMDLNFVAFLQYLNFTNLIFRYIGKYDVFKVVHTY